jgi:hypothetical protein
VEGDKWKLSLIIPLSFILLQSYRPIEKMDLELLERRSEPDDYSVYLPHVSTLLQPYDSNSPTLNASDMMDRNEMNNRNEKNDVGKRSCGRRRWRRKNKKKKKSGRWQ